MIQTRHLQYFFKKIFFKQLQTRDTIKNDTIKIRYQKSHVRKLQMINSILIDFDFQLEKDKQLLKAHYELPNNPHIIVHPNATAKGGKFNCSVATLSLLLDYRITDNKEHSFEVCINCV